MQKPKNSSGGLPTPCHEWGLNLREMDCQSILLPPLPPVGEYREGKDRWWWQSVCERCERRTRERESAKKVERVIIEVCVSNNWSNNWGFRKYIPQKRIFFIFHIDHWWVRSDSRSSAFQPHSELLLLVLSQSLPVNFSDPFLYFTAKQFLSERVDVDVPLSLLKVTKSRKIEK